MYGFIHLHKIFYTLYIRFAEDNKNFLYNNTSLKNGKSDLTHSIKKMNSLRVAKAIVAMFFSLNGDEDSMGMKIQWISHS
ncbi:hypothetical protein EsFM111_25780 [Enterococcus sp. FM11-1]|nr:hypothetical protein EsFM111_25780 [Enterococcus sp. FM11-1]